MPLGAHFLFTAWLIQATIYLLVRTQSNLEYSHNSLEEMVIPYNHISKSFKPLSLYLAPTYLTKESIKSRWTDTPVESQAVGSTRPSITAWSIQAVIYWLDNILTLIAVIARWTDTGVDS